MLPLRPLFQRSLRTYLPNLHISNGLHDADKFSSSNKEETSQEPDHSPTRKVFETTPIVPSTSERTKFKDEPHNSTEIAEDSVIVPPFPAPEECCMSGCANCVWITYAAEINRIYRDGGETARKLILQQMEDPTMKAFITLEIRVNANAISSTDTKKTDATKADANK